MEKMIVENFNATKPLWARPFRVRKAKGARGRGLDWGVRPGRRPSALHEHTAHAWGGCRSDFRLNEYARNISVRGRKSRLSIKLRACSASWHTDLCRPYDAYEQHATAPGLAARDGNEWLIYRGPSLSGQVNSDALELNADSTRPMNWAIGPLGHPLIGTKGESAREWKGESMLLRARTADLPSQELKIICH